MLVPALPVGLLFAPDQLDQLAVGLAARHRGIERADERIEHLPGIARDRDFRRVIGVEDVGIDIDVDQILRNLRAVAAGRNLGKPRSHGVFFFTDTATTEIYTLSLHDALPI